MSSPIVIENALTEAQLACLDLLNEAVAEAEKGNVYSVGIIVCMKTGFATTIGGTDAGSLNLGCDAMKARILERVTDEGARRKPSQIVRG